MIGALLCRLGQHAPVAGGRWNGGYCFTRCGRCDRDMVRSAFGEWHVPKAFRIVWSDAPACDLDDALEARAATPPTNEAAAPRPAPSSPFDFSDFDCAVGAAAPSTDDVAPPRNAIAAAQRSDARAAKPG